MTVIFFDTGIVVSGDDSASILEAIKNQTDDINQNHQETMDKIDEQYNTDSSGEINSGYRMRPIRRLKAWALSAMRIVS